METEKRIAVIGYSGGGKSTLARWLGQYFALPVLHLDSVSFEAGWQERDRSTARQLVGQFMQQPGWVIDGNYRGFYASERLYQATDIVFLNFNRWRSLARVVRRLRHYRGRTRPDMAAGCPEKIDAEFVRWVLWKGRSKDRRRWYAEICRTYPQKVVVLRNQRGINAYLEQLH